MRNEGCEKLHPKIFTLYKNFLYPPTYLTKIVFITFSSIDRNEMGKSNYEYKIMGNIESNKYFFIINRYEMKM